MHILVVGAAGMLGRKLTRELVRNATLGGRRIEKLSPGFRDPIPRTERADQLHRL